MSGGGGSGSDGGGDMQVSGAEAAYSTEKGISTHADTRVSRESFSPGGEGGWKDPGTHTTGDTGGVHDTSTQSTRTLGPDTSTVGIAAPSYSSSEVEKGYTNTGEKLHNVNGTMMTKGQMYSTGVIEKDPVTGEDKQGRYRVNPNSGELERADLSFKEHWANRPDSIKWSPTLSLLYAGGKNIGEWFSNKNWGSTTSNITPADDRGDGMSERQRMNVVAPHAPYIVSGTTKPTNSPAANWYQGLGGSSTNPNTFNLATEFAAAKSKQAVILGNSSAVGKLAANQTPYFDFLQKHSLTKGIL